MMTMTKISKTQTITTVKNNEVALPSFKTLDDVIAWYSRKEDTLGKLIGYDFGTTMIVYDYILKNSDGTKLERELVREWRLK